MDLISHIPGVGPVGPFNPGATTPAPYNVPQTGAVDGTGPANATKNMAELYNRDLLWRRALIAASGLAFDPTNWIQEVTAIQTLIASVAASYINAGGTADVITGDFTPDIISLANPFTVYVRASARNATTTPTFKADATAVQTIVKAAGIPLAEGDISGAGFWMELRNDPTLGKWVLMNPATGVLPQTGFRHKLLNGDFSVNQRQVAGAQVLAAGVFAHDRWKAGAAGCSYSFATVNNVTTVTITAGSLIQTIEGKRLQSGTHVLSWGGTAQGKIAAGAYSASGVTAVVVGGTNTAVEFNVGTLILPQFEPGVNPSAFEFRPGLELYLCQRYLPPVFIGANDPIGSDYTSITPTNFNVFVKIAQETYAPITGIAYSNPGHFNVNTTPGGGVVSALSFGSAGKNGVNLQFVASAGSAGGGGYIQTNTSIAFLYFTGPEL
ncbi:MAG: hypothetical protein V4706_02860 [Pseudomonadota bacterium]